jgi:Rieske Fe-S protein
MVLFQLLLPTTASTGTNAMTPLAETRRRAGDSPLRERHTYGMRAGWNTGQLDMACPYHGSRFMPTGVVISGPAEAPFSTLE